MKKKKVFLWNTETNEKVQFDPEHADNLFAIHPGGGGWKWYVGQDKSLKNGLPKSTGDTSNTEQGSADKPSDETVSEG